MPTFHPRAAATVLVLSAAALLVACERDGTRENAGTTTMNTDAAQRKAGEVATDVRKGAQEAADTISRATKDMAITTGIKTRLASDSQLSALDINVDTTEGRVLLRGTAPDTAARSHAGELARSVAGVVDVRNDLSVQVPSK